MRFSKFIPILLFTNVSLGEALTQVEIVSTPEASDGVIEVCAGSTILFENATDPGLVNGPTNYYWTVPGATIDPVVSSTVFQQFQTPGTYTVSLNVVTQGGDVDLGISTLTIEVSEAPPLVPELISGHPCTQTDTLELFTDVVVFQTQSGQSSCTCTPSSIGPLLAINNTNAYPAGTVSHIYWGGAGSPVNGGSSAFTTQEGFPTSETTLQQFPGQFTASGHYSNQGSYNLVHVVEFPNGCTYSDYYIVSWGAALIDQCSGMAQSVCSPSDYMLCFDSQAPGTNYQIDWGDGTSAFYTYPNLPTIPNQLGHAYAESCEDGSVYPTVYTITINAFNACENLTTENTEGPFFVSTAPLPAFNMSQEPTICQFESVTFTDSSFPGFEAGGAGCFSDHFRFWTINGSEEMSGPGYTVQSGELGDDFFFISGTEAIDVDFTQPGTYDVTLTVSNTFCEPQSVTQTVTVEASPEVASTSVTLCLGEPLDFIPNSPFDLIPEGTSFSWTVADNPLVEGDTAGVGSSIQGELINLTNTTQSIEYTVLPTSPNACSSSPFTLAVNLLPSIAIPDFSETVCNGTAISLSPSDLNASSLPEETLFSWSFEANPAVIGATEGNMQPVFTQTLYTSTVSPALTAHYEVLALFNENCPLDTFSFDVTLNNVEAATIASDQLICPNSSPVPLTIAIPPLASGMMNQQWMEFNPNLGSYIAIAGATGEELMIPASNNPNRQFALKSTSTLNESSCSAFSNPVTVEYISQVFSAVAGEQTVCVNAPLAPISATFSADADLAWEWQQWMPSLNAWETIPGAQAPTFLPSPAAFDRFFRPVVQLTVDEATCTAQGPTIPIWINQINAGQTIPSQSGCPGDAAIPLQTENMFIDGDGLFEWFMSISPNGPWTSIGTGSLFEPDAPFAEPTTYYRAEVTSIQNGTACSAFSNPPALLQQLPADVVGECGGTCVWDLDQDGTCDIDQSVGCMDMNACNFISGAIIDDGSCTYPPEGFNCLGDCLLDLDGDGICDQNEIHGCSDSQAINYNPNTTEPIECYYGSSCPSDLNLDGIIGVSDILTLLSNYGMNCDD